MSGEAASRTRFEHVSTVIAAYTPVQLPAAAWRQAAVLVPLRRIAETDELEVILTRRSAALANHSGQVAFPGGGVDPADASVEAAALREANEELAISPQDVRVLGRLDDMLSYTGFHIVPVVGLVASSAVFTPAVAEVARVFTVPLAQLADKPKWELRSHTRGERTYELPHFYAEDEDIWGLTAFILLRLVELL